MSFLLQCATLADAIAFALPRPEAVEVTPRTPPPAPSKEDPDVGKLPISLLIRAYYNVVKPQDGAGWQLRT
jgi:hypothetical protein